MDYTAHHVDNGFFASFREWWSGTLCYSCGKRFRSDDYGRKLCYVCGFDNMVKRFEREEQRRQQLFEAQIKVLSRKVSDV